MYFLIAKLGELALEIMVVWGSEVGYRGGGRVLNLNGKDK